MQFQLLLLSNLNQHISFSYWSICILGQCSENDAVNVTVTKSFPSANYSLARQPGHKGTILSTCEKVRTYLLSFQNFLHDHICKRGSEWRGLLDHFTQRYNEFHDVLFKPSHNFTYKFNLSEVACWFKPLGRRILVKSFKCIINILSYKGKINS